MSVYEYAFQPFVDYGFMRRALAACAALAVSGAPLGLFLMLRRMTLVGDAMSHAIAGTITRLTQLKEDASFTGTYILSLAAGVLIISLHGNTLDLMHVLFGNVLAVDNQSLLLVTCIASVSSLTLAAIYRSLIVECFDPGFLRAVHGKGALIHQLFLVLVVLNLVSAFQALGTMMALGMMVLPAIAARFWTRTIDCTVALSIALGLVSAFTGLLLSYHYALPSGPAIVLTAGGLYVFSVLFGWYGSITVRLLPKKHFAH